MFLTVPRHPMILDVKKVPLLVLPSPDGWGNIGQVIDSLSYKLHHHISALEIRVRLRVTLL